METLDLKKKFKQLYSLPKNQVMIVDVPEFNYIMIDGIGDPNHSVAFQEAVSALYTVSYTLKFMFKKGPQEIDYAVMPLEGLWWMDDMTQFTIENKAKWKWTMMIVQPDFVTKAIFQEACIAAGKKKELPALPKLRLEKMKEGPAAQTLYFGPYSGEGPTIMKLHDFVKENGYQLSGKHREIYLNDMRKTAPEKLKTVIRQPLKR